MKPPTPQPQPQKITRRAFVTRSAAALAAPYIVRASALGLGAAVAPSNRITLGFIGIGMMGQGHLRHCLHYGDVQILAVCDVDKWRRDRAKAAVEAAYANQPAAGRPRCHAYNDLRNLLARDDIDAVVIATGDRWHAPATVLAAKAGKDIYCEKPISLTIRGARAMVNAVRRYARVFQAGLQQRSTAEFRIATQLVRDGAIGKVRVVYVNHPGTCGDVGLRPEPVPAGLDWDLWLGPAPWHPYNRRFHPYGRPPRVVPWQFCRDFGGGNLTSNAVHAFDVVQWGLGMDHTGPVRITPPGAGGRHLLTYTYPGGTLCQVVPGRLDKRAVLIPPGWNLGTHLTSFGALFVGQEGWIHVGRRGYLECFPRKILEQATGLRGRKGSVTSHHQNWFDCIRTRNRTACDVSVGCQSTIVSHLGCIAHWTGRSLKWDPAGEVFAGDSEANRWRARAMRAPWTL
ncbi:MAG: Gfo/Idh/MocA family oxidoreductase [Phycisphaerae bacterium]|nr:Gfo/Idh/MocA family oxidoreductase [Phycisphaerae bacterium]